MLGTWAADIRPSHKDEVMQALKQLKDDAEHDRNHFIQAMDDGAHAMEDLETKVDRHAKAAIFYREQQDKKYDQLRDLTMIATQRALEADNKVTDLKQQNEQQKKLIKALGGGVMRMMETVKQLKAQGTPGKTNE